MGRDRGTRWDRGGCLAGVGRGMVVGLRSGQGRAGYGWAGGWVYGVG